MLIPKTSFKAIEDLNKVGLHLQAYEKLLQAGEPSELEDVDQLLLASGIFHNLGAVQASKKFTKKARNREPLNPRVLFYKASDAMHFRGPLPALLFIRKYEPHFSGEAKITSWWHSLRVEIYSVLRDFEEADKWHAKAVKAKSDEPWVWVSKAQSLENQDRYEESLVVSRKAFEIDPNNRTAISAFANSLILAQKDDEALDLLNGASARMENAFITKQLADIQGELGLKEEAFKNLKRILELTPIKEKEFSEWLYANLSDSAYQNGLIDDALKYAEKSKSKFHLKIKENIEKAKTGATRKVLDLGFVRQHHLTCAPATITNISRYWNKKAEHLDVSDEMCYDGTPAYKERGWADKNGWTTREFKLNIDNSKELIDREIPFTLTTIHPGNGHLQAVIGYDERRGSLMIRDPYYRYVGEFELENGLKNQMSTGPRGMLLVPKEKSHLLDGLKFNESSQYDFLYKIDTALEEFRREDAVKLLSEMTEQYPDHRLSWSAHWALSRFDSNNVSLIEAIENLQKKFPDDVNLKLSYFSICDEFISRDELLEKLEEASKAKETDPLIWQMYGYELGQDAEQHSKAIRWLYKTIRSIPTNATSYRLLADILWAKREREDAVELYRIAACLQDTDEQFAFSYFSAESYLDRREKAIKFLRDRYQRFGHLSSDPVQTLFHSLRESGGTVEAFEVLDDALKKRPDDYNLKTFAAEAGARYGRKEKAIKLLEESRNKSDPKMWLMTAALIAELDGNFDKCLEYWREIVNIDPVSYQAHEKIAEMLSILEGQNAAQKYLRKVTGQFPNNRSLHRLRLEYLADNNTEGIAVLRHLINLNPRDAWSQREISRWFLKVKKYPQALEASEVALKIEPNEPLNHWSKGAVLGQTNKYREAVEAYKSAIMLDADSDFAFFYWFDGCRTIDEKKEALEFLELKLKSQQIIGKGVEVYHQYAKSIVEPEILLEKLNEIFAKNRDVKACFSAIVGQLTDMGKLVEALDIAVRGVERFPLEFEVWHDLSVVYKYLGDNKKEINALKRSLEVNENWSFGIQQLSEAFVRDSNLKDANNLLQSAVKRLPLDNFVYGHLADVLWKLEKKDEAIEAAKRAISIEPEYDWAWRMIKHWSEETDEPNLAVDLARELVKSKPEDVKANLIYAEMLSGEIVSEEYLKTIEGVLRLDKTNVQALALKANALADSGRIQEAFDICTTENSAGYVDDQLKFVRAGLESTRGNFQESLRILEELTRSSPDYYPAWERLAAFYSESEESKSDYLRVTEGMARLAPQDPITLGYFGEACLLNSKREDAKRVFKQAITASPEYEFGLLSLFDLHLEDNEFKKAEATIGIMRRFLKNDNSILKEIFYHTRVGDLDSAEKRFKELCFSSTADVFHFHHFSEKMREYSMLKEPFVMKVLQETSSNPRANPHIGRTYVNKCWEKEGESGCWQKLSAIRSNKKVWSAGMSRFVEILVQERTESYVKEFIDNNSADLQTDTEIWGMTGFALNSIGDVETGERWFENWEEREDVKPWMLWNYSLMLRNQDKYEDADSVSRKALDLEPDEVTNLHRVFVCLSDMHKEKFQAVWENFVKIEGSGFLEWEAFFYGLVDLGLRINGAYSNGQNAEADFLIGRLMGFADSDSPIWEDQIMKNMFKKSVGIALGQTDSKWLKYTSKISMFFVRLGISRF